MTISLVGTVVSTADTAGDFSTRNGGVNISGDDDFVQGTGAVGDKMSNTAELIVSDNLAGGAAGVYDFSVGGANEGAHFIGWINTKTPIDATTGIGVYFRNAAGHFGVANVMPASFYKGGFTTRVWNPSADFNTATTWTTTGNPAQLDDVSEMGFQFTTITSIMGSFNNTQIDQLTVGDGIRADAGTSGSPNTFESVRVVDEDTNYWGWWSAQNGAYVGKGKLFIGPETGTAASDFTDTSFAVSFADENVAVGFYEFLIRGANTVCSWTLANIAAANPVSARWSLTLDSAMGSVTGGFTDTNGVLSGSDVITLCAGATLTGTSIINGNSCSQFGATLTGITVIGANRTSGQAYLLCDDIEAVTDSDFQSSGTGHAVEYRPTGASFDVLWSGNTTSGYAGTDGSTGNEALLINPVTTSADVTLNVVDGANPPSIMLAAGYTGTFTLINNPVTLTLTGMELNTEVRIYLTGSTTEIAGQEDVTTGSFGYTYVHSGTDLEVDIVVHSVGYEYQRINSFFLTANNSTLPIQQRFDRNYANA